VLNNYYAHSIKLCLDGTIDVSNIIFVCESSWWRFMISINNKALKLTNLAGVISVENNLKKEFTLGKGLFVV